MVSCPLRLHIYTLYEAILSSCVSIKTAGDLGNESHRPSLHKDMVTQQRPAKRIWGWCGWHLRFRALADALGHHIKVWGLKMLLSHGDFFQTSCDSLSNSFILFRPHCRNYKLLWNLVFGDYFRSYFRTVTLWHIGRNRILPKTWWPSASLLTWRNI